MTIFGNIYDTADNTSLSGASVQVVNSAGQPTGAGVATDPQGYFTITSPVLDQGGKLLISAISHTSVVVNPTVFNTTGFVGLDPDPEDLQAATVTATIKKNVKYLPYVAAGAGLLLLASTGKKKKKRSVGGIDIDWKFVAVAGGVAVGGYFIIVKPILQKLGVLDTPNVNDQATADAQQRSLDQAKKTQSATYPDSQYQNWANEIERLGPNDDQSGIVNIVSQCNNLVDWLSLVNAWGIRREGGFMCATFNMYCTTYDLPSYLREVLDATRINNLNLYFSAQGITYQL